MTPYDLYLARGIFDEIDRSLDQPDCKTARRIVRSVSTVRLLRMQTEHRTPLNIRISTKGKVRAWLQTATLLTLSGFGIFGVATFVMDASGLPLDPMPMSAAPSLMTGNDYYPPEEQ